METTPFRLRGRKQIRRKAIAHGLIYAAADRRRDGLFLVHGARTNIAVPHWTGILTVIAVVGFSLELKRR